MYGSLGTDSCWPREGEESSGDGAQAEILLTLQDKLLKCRPAIRLAQFSVKSLHTDAGNHLWDGK